MYPLMRIVAPKLGVRFMNLGYWPSSAPQYAKMRMFMEDLGDLDEYGKMKTLIEVSLLI